MKKRVGIVAGLILLAAPLLILLGEGLDLAPEEKWVARYNGPENRDDWAQAIAVDSSGNVYITGSTGSLKTGRDYLTIKYDSNGQLLWAKRYDGPFNDTDDAGAIAVDSSGNVYVTGCSYGLSGSMYREDFATIKYSPNGKQLWVKRYNGPGNGFDRAVAIAVDGSGNVYVAGQTWISKAVYAFAIIKYSPNGNRLWIKTYKGPNNSSAWAMASAVDGSGNVYITGDCGLSGFSDYATIKYSPNGKQLWVKTYNGPSNSGDGAWAIAVDRSGNVYVTGESENDYATIKYNTNGKQLWVSRYNGQGNRWDNANAIAVDSSGNVYVTGNSRSPSSLIGNYATIKYGPNGNQLWVKRYNGTGNGDDSTTAIAVDRSGNVYVTGESKGSDIHGDYATIQYDTNGNQLWVKRYNGPRNMRDWPRGIAIDSSANVYVTGWSDGKGTLLDCATIKYGPKEKTALAKKAQRTR